ncbi:MAG: hydrogen gas-evolving membrane-bound hydrogenase subunit E [Desulfosalsimonadaceae bacterium]
MHESNRTKHLARASSVLPLAVFALACAAVPETAAGGVFRFELPWAPGLGVNLSFLVDGLAVLFVLIASAVGFFVSVYAVDYLHGHGYTGRFFVFLHSFMLSMAGLVTADNVIALFVFWELTTVFSFLLIGFEHDKPEARRSARQALLVTGAGGLALLAGFLLLKIMAGTYTMSEMIGLSDVLKNHRLYGTVLVLIFLGAFTKSALFPFHFWLPDAMAAPAPISAFLHSATMVKAGIYLLARFHPILGGTMAWTAPLMVVGAVTAAGSVLLAIFQTDLKKILAYTTLTALGLMTMFLGGSASPSLTAAITFLLVHSLYKSGLFLAAGIIDHQTGTREVSALGGLMKSMPATAFAVFAACLSMAGFPLFFGFIGKEIMYKGALAEALCPALAAGAAVFSNALMTAIAGIVAIGPFLGKTGNFPASRGEAPVCMWCGPVVLGGLGIVFGLVPDQVGHWLVQPAVRAFDVSGKDIKLSLFHGINEPLLLSALTLLLGLCFYLRRRSLSNWLSAAANRFPATASGVYDWCLQAVSAAGRMQTRLLQNGSLHHYFFIVVAAFLFSAGYGYLTGAPDLPALSVPGLPLWQWLLVSVIAMAVMTVVATRIMLLAICAMGVVGAAIALIFVSFGAPDLALTQLLVETLTVIIVSMILLRLPRMEKQPRPQRMRRVFDGLLAAGTGVMVAVLMLAVLSIPLDRSVTAFFEHNSYLAAHGKNIVNVILVDFRSMDTLGEVTVVAAAGLAAYALIEKKRSN